MSEKRIIGILAGSESAARPLEAAVQRSGGVALLLKPGSALSRGQALPRLDGLIVERGPGQGPALDAAGEGLPMLAAALGSDLPILGVGGGMQALNLALGGTHAVQVTGHDVTRKDGEEVSSYHRIYIAPGSKLAAVLGSGGFVRVNSRHALGVREAQKSPLAMASAYGLDDGVVEALESPDHDLVIAVQFHPELRKEVPLNFNRLFQALVQRAQRREHPAVDSSR